MRGLLPLYALAVVSSEIGCVGDSSSDSASDFGRSSYYIDLEVRFSPALFNNPNFEAQVRPYDLAGLKVTSSVTRIAPSWTYSQDNLFRTFEDFPPDNFLPAYPGAVFKRVMRLDLPGFICVQAGFYPGYVLGEDSVVGAAGSECTPVPADYDGQSLELELPPKSVWPETVEVIVDTLGNRRIFGKRRWYDNCVDPSCDSL